MTIFTPNDISRISGVIRKRRKGYQGKAVTLSTRQGEAIIIADGPTTLRNICREIMPRSFVMEERLLQDVAIFDSSHVEQVDACKCESCKNGYNGKQGNGYQPCSCSEK